MIEKYKRIIIINILQQETCFLKVKLIQQRDGHTVCYAYTIQV